MLDLSRLSEEQRRVALAPDGPLLVIAGPGSGKTTTMAARIAYLLDGRQVGPGSVLAVTFTRAAARALRARLVTMLGERGQAVDVTTLHGFGLRVIRHWSGQIGFAPGGPLRVCGAACSRTLLREVLEGAGGGEHSRADGMARALERHRLRATDIAALRDGAKYSSGSRGCDAPLVVLAAAYEDLLLRRRLVDYAAMLAWPVRLFDASPTALRLCQDAYRTVLADEFQDLCAIQYTLLRLLAARHRNLVAVGDPCQSVYGWRGADAELFERFLRDFPDARVHTLEQNFRSTGRIVGLANAMGVDLGVPRRLWTANPPGPEALVYGAADEADEARFVAAEIERLAAAGAIRHVGEVAVLYRTNEQAQGLKRALRERGLAWRLQAASDPAAEADDDLAPSATPRVPAPSATPVTPASPQAAVTGGRESAPVIDAAPRVVLTTIHAAKGEEWRVVFVVGVEEGLLPHARTLDEGADRPARAGRRLADAGDGLADELRVAYVAVTRPRERLYLSYCRSRSRGEWREPRGPSRFLRRLPADLLAAAVPATASTDRPAGPTIAA